MVSNCYHCFVEKNDVIDDLRLSMIFALDDWPDERRGHQSFYDMKMSII